MTPYRLEIEVAARAHDLDPDLIEAMVHVESRGRFDAYRYEPGFWRRYLQDHPRYKGLKPEEVSASYGLMQIMYSTAVDQGYQGTPWGLFDPRESLYWGSAYLAKQIQWARRMGPNAPSEVQIASALAAYNGGRTGNLPDDEPDRNAAYAHDVLAEYSSIKGSN